MAAERCARLRCGIICRDVRGAGTIASRVRGRAVCLAAAVPAGFTGRAICLVAAVRSCVPRCGVGLAAAICGSDLRRSIGPHGPVDTCVPSLGNGLAAAIRACVLWRCIALAGAVQDRVTDRSVILGRAVRDRIPCRSVRLTGAIGTGVGSARFCTCGVAGRAIPRVARETLVPQGVTQRTLTGSKAKRTIAGSRPLATPAAVLRSRRRADFPGAAAASPSMAMCAPIGLAPRALSRRVGLGRAWPDRKRAPHL